MALTSVITFDIVGQNLSMTFNTPSIVDQITFSSGSITFAACSTYSLTKSDFALYYQYKLSFYNSLFSNFGSIGNSLNASWPIPGTEFIVNTINSPPERIIYTYNSLGTQVLNMSFLPVANEVTISARPAPITITPQEWFSNLAFLAQFVTQVAAN